MPKTYDKQTGAFLGTVAECMPDLPSSVMQGWVENPLFLARILKSLHPWCDKEVWRFNCALPCSKEAHFMDQIFQKERDGKITLGFWGKKLFEAVFYKVPKWDGEYSTVRLKLKELGFTENVMLCDFKKRARQFGLIECPHFVAYHYRLRYEKQPLHEHLYILTESVVLSDGELSLFGLTHLPVENAKTHQVQSRLWLDGHHGEANFLWSPDTEWVFALKE